MQNFTTSQFYGLKDHSLFMKHIQDAVDQMEHKVGIFAGDHIFTYNRNLSFLEDEKFMAAFYAHTSDLAEQSLIWRYATVCWAAKNGAKLDGDFVEIACYKGTTARIVCDYMDMKNSDRKYFLYDLFEHDEKMPHHAMPDHSKSLYQQVQEKFSDFPNVCITQGNIPDSLTIAAPEKIAFMHLDINNAQAEIGALDVLFERMVPGAVLILDDYGWVYYREQKLAEDPWFEKLGYQVLELPTGQGMVIKQ
ncbi:TylF/MycF/NovP-related O-methyltransferase [Undibacterium sp. Ji83W]|uniref:TylF/MycF/NovP-related O-methyltransferase n=1 Tax=Undibacterium sp. Ji83W TaxID=3413043 RepID=UPI003BEFA117